MLYVILDPGGDYPAPMVEFLGGRGLAALAVFTDEARLAAYRHMFQARLGRFVRDEYLLTQFPDLGALAATIRHDHPGPLHGIIPWHEMCTYLGAQLGALLGIEWNPPEVLLRFRDKFAMKSHLRAHGTMRVNASRVVEDPDQAIAFRREVGRWPLVVKPTAGAGSRDVFFVHDDATLVARCVQVSRAGTGQVLLEEYVGGTEHVVNGIVDARGDLLVTEVWRYDRRAFMGVPNLYYQTFKVSTHEPSFWPLAEYAGAVVECLGLKRAPIHMEVKLDERGPCLIEVGARFAGGNHPYLSSTLHGRSLFELAACHYLAELPVSLADVDYARYDSLHVRIVSGQQPVAIPRITTLLGTDEVERLPTFHGFAELKPPGAPLPVTTDLYTRSYVVYLLGPDPDQIERDAAAVRHLLRYV